MTAFNPIYARGMDGVRLDACGDPVVGADSYFAAVNTDGGSDNLIRVTLTPDYFTPNDITRENGFGKRYVNIKGQPQLQGYRVQLDIAGLMPAVEAALMGDTVLGTGVAHVETLTVDATGGTFDISVGDETASALDGTITNSALETALEGLANVGAGNVSVTGGPGDAGGTTPYVITFQGTLATSSIPDMTVDGSSLTGGAGTATLATTTKGGPASGLKAGKRSVNTDGWSLRFFQDVDNSVCDGSGIPSLIHVLGRTESWFRTGEFAMENDVAGISFEGYARENSQFSTGPFGDLATGDAFNDEDIYFYDLRYDADLPTDTAGQVVAWPIV